MRMMHMKNMTWVRFVETFWSRSDKRILASHAVAGSEGARSVVLKGLRIMSVFQRPFRTSSLRRNFQPLRGWLISIVASRPRQSFQAAIWFLVLLAATVYGRAQV